MNRIDVHADDYGLTMNTSKKILAGINAGKLNSISILANMKNYDAALALWKKELKNDKLSKISVHLNFMEGHCLASKEKVSLLVDECGYFKLSWIDLVKYNYDFFKYSIVKKQLKIEIKEQIYKVVEDYELLKGKKLRVDSHQHTHMIPIVMKALLEVLEEESIPTEYIRISKETVIPYLKQVKYYSTYRIINLVKVAILNFFSFEDERVLKVRGIPTMILSGVFMSGHMDLERVQTILPDLKKKAVKRNVLLEVLVHPGRALEEEIGEEFVSMEANEFYLSKNREIEYQTMMKLKK